MAYCGQCGSRVYERDQFCGSCGAILLPEHRDSAYTQEIPSQPRTPQTPQYTASNNSTRLLVLAASAGLLLILLGGIGAIALTGVNPIASAFGGNVTAGEESGDSPEAATPPPVAEEDTAETEDPVEAFVDEYYGYVQAEDWAGTYSLLDEETQAEFSEEEWIEVQNARASAEGNPALTSAEYEGTYTHHPSGADYGVEITLSYEDGSVDQIDKALALEGGEYKRHFTEDELDYLEQFREDQSGTDTAELEAEAEAAVNDYYQAAGLQDWGYTYDNLAAETQSLFSEEEWSDKNQWYVDQDETIYHIESVDLIEQSIEANPVVDVEVRLTGEDGSSLVRETAFTLEDGSWKHIFLEEEIQSFRPDLTYEEFLEVQ